MGVEEEFLLVDASSGKPVADAAEVLAAAGSLPGAGGMLHPELIASQVEASTGICTTEPELRQHLLDARSALGRAARARGARLLSTGTPPLAGTPPAATEGERFRRITGIYAGMVADYQVCGCHVHVGVPDREHAVAVIGLLRPWLPTLLALSVNSPFERGRDTGHQSWRMVEQARFPGAGVPPLFGSAAAHDAELARLVDCGVLVDEQMSFWLARPSGRFPTVEFRVADAALAVEDAVLQAVLSRAMVVTALSEVERGAAAPVLRDQVLAAAVWTAARYGLGGPAVDPWRERRTRSSVLVRALLGWVAPALAEAGDLDLVLGVVDRVLQEGTGADRQRHAAHRGTAALLGVLSADEQV